MLASLALFVHARANIKWNLSALEELNSLCSLQMPNVASNVGASTWRLLRSKPNKHQFLRGIIQNRAWQIISKARSNSSISQSHPDKQTEQWEMTCRYFRPIIRNPARLKISWLHRWLDSQFVKGDDPSFGKSGLIFHRGSFAECQISKYRTKRVLPKRASAMRTAMSDGSAASSLPLSEPFFSRLSPGPLLQIIWGRTRKKRLNTETDTRIFYPMLVRLINIKYLRLVVQFVFLVTSSQKADKRRLLFTLFFNSFV